MDRNYFLSYGQIVFLLLLSAIGRLNVSIISSIVGKTTLLHHTDIKNTDPYSSFSDTLSQRPAISVRCNPYHYADANCNNLLHTVCEKYLQGNMPIVNGQDSFLLPIMKSISVGYKWNIPGSLDYAHILNIIKLLKKYIISVRLIDGFKFIIKIHDKLTIALIK